MERALTLLDMALYSQSLTQARQLQTVFRDGGAGHVACWMAKRIFSPFCQTGYIVFFGRDLVNYSRISANNTPIRLTLLIQDDCELLASGRPNDSRAVERANERFNKGHQCFVAHASANEVVHSRWVSTSDTYIPELRMNTRPGPRQAYMYDGYSKPDYRGRGIDGAVRNFIFETMKSQGFESVYSYVRSDNPVGIRAAKRWQDVLGTVWYFQLRDAEPWVVGLSQTSLPTLLTT
jgi:ribosomal protein S18 acetylase RimI-like enzyme